MPDQFIPVLIVAAVVLLALIGMIVGWRARIRRQGGLGTPQSPPDDLGLLRFSADAAYVATTLAERPLERIAVAGLGIRGRATASVYEHGVLIDRVGATVLYIPADAIASAGFGTFAVDRVVERDGLAVISWRLGDTAVDSYLRPATGDAKRGIVDAVHTLIPGSLTSDAGTSEGTTSANP